VPDFANVMVDLDARDEKLRVRARRIVGDAPGASQDRIEDGSA
jgi:N-acetylmuramic acid 6-phosphate (MurNAc-6-P) etherase